MKPQLRHREDSVTPVTHLVLLVHLQAFYEQCQVNLGAKISCNFISLSWIWTNLEMKVTYIIFYAKFSGTTITLIILYLCCDLKEASDHLLLFCEAGDCITIHRTFEFKTWKKVSKSKFTVTNYIRHNQICYIMLLQTTKYSFFCHMVMQTLESLHWIWIWILEYESLNMNLWIWIFEYGDKKTWVRWKYSYVMVRNCVKVSWNKI